MLLLAYGPLFGIGLGIPIAVIMILILGSSGRSSDKE